MPRKIILDVDPGHDDAMAILLAAKHLDVLGVTTVAGNQTIEKTTINALKVVELGGLTHIPVARGSARPLVSEPLHAPIIHGETGLDGAELPEPTTSLEPRHAVEFIVETVRGRNGVSLVPTGPLTNVGTALRRAPDIAERIPEISLMGGSVGGGNTTAAAEFNIYCDPEAAHIVFSSGIPIKMSGLNITRQAAATVGRRDRIRSLGNRTGRVVAGWLDFFSARVKEVFNIDGGSLHDAVAVAWLIDPTLIKSETMHVAVELKGELTRGMTVCDQRYPSQVTGGIRRRLPSNVEVGMELDVERFFALLYDSLAAYP